MSQGAGDAGGLSARLRDLVSTHLEVEPHRLRPEARLGEDLCIDSLAATELALILEDEFDIAIPDAEREGVLTYGDVEDLVSAKLAERAGGPG